jgi:hypothetical protein
MSAGRPISQGVCPPLVYQHNKHKSFNALTGIQATAIYSILQQSRKATVYHSGREVTIRDVVIRDIKTTTVSQMRDVHIRDKIIKDCILLGSQLTIGM